MQEILKMERMPKKGEVIKGEGNGKCLKEKKLLCEEKKIESVIYKKI